MRRCIRYALGRKRKDETFDFVLKLVSSFGKMGSATADGLQERMSEWFQRFPPTDTYMAELSLLYNKYEGTHGLEEYSIITVLSAATHHICTASKVVARTKVRSLPARTAGCKTKRKTRSW